MACVYRTGHSGGSALYAVATSIVALLPFSDLGLGLALVTQLPKVADDLAAARRVVSTSFATLALVAVVAVTTVVLITPWVSWRGVLGVGTDSSAASAALIVVVGVAVGGPVSVAGKTLFSLGRVGWFFGIDCCSAVVSICLAAGGLIVKAPVEYFIASTVWSPVVTASVASVVVFCFRWTHLRPSVAFVSKAVLRRQLALGMTLAYAGIAVAISMQSDLLIVSHLLDENAVASYGLAMRLGVIFFSLSAVFITPLWPEFARLINTRQVGIIRRLLYSTTVRVTAAAVVFLIFATVLGPPLLRLWSDHAQAVSAALCGAVALNVGVQAVQLPVSMFVNARGQKTVIATTATAMCAVNLVLSVVLTLWLGVEGPALGTTAAVIVGLAAPLGIYTLRELRRMERGAGVSSPVGAA